MHKFWKVLFKLVLLGLLLSPFIALYMFLTDPVNFITSIISLYLVFVMLVIPISLLLIVLFGVVGLIRSIFKTIFSKTVKR